MNLQKTTPAYDLIEIGSAFLACGIQLSEEDWKRLLHHQNKVCRSLDWIETDSLKIEDVIKPFLQTRLLHQNNMFEILYKMITTYYQLRSRYDWHISDEALIALMELEFKRYLGSNLESFEERIETETQQMGGKKYRELFTAY